MQRWLYCAVPNGSATVGWLAAHPYGAWVHIVGRVSKPCRRRMSGGALDCPLCDVDLARWRGYTAFYSREYRRMFVMVGPDTREWVAGLEVHTQIEISRPKDSKAGVLIRDKIWRTAPLPASAERPREIDLTSFLLRLWGDQELLAWHAANRDSGVSLPTGGPPVGPCVTPPVSADAPAELVARVAAARHKAAHPPATIAAVIDHVQAGGRESGLYTPGRPAGPEPK